MGSPLPPQAASRMTGLMAHTKMHVEGSGEDGDLPCALGWEGIKTQKAKHPQR